MNVRLLRSPAFLLSAAILLASAAGLNAAVTGLKLHLRKKPIEVDLKVQSIPAQTHGRDIGGAGGWQQVGVDQTMSKELVDELGTTNYVSRFYERKTPLPDGKKPVVELHLAYYTGMIDTVPHVPERCLVGGGWAIKRTAGLTPLALDLGRWRVDTGASGQGRTIYSGRLSSGLHRRLPAGVESAAVNVTEFEKPGTESRLISGYFFVANGGMCGRAEDVRLLAFDLKSEYAFYLKVQVSSMSAASAEELAALASELLNDLFPDIMMCVPDWHDVEQGLYPPRAEQNGGAAIKG